MSTDGQPPERAPAAASHGLVCVRCVGRKFRTLEIAPGQAKRGGIRISDIRNRKGA